MTEALFDLDLAEQPVDPTEGMSAQRLLTWRQAERLDRGLHPLSITNGHIALHPDAAPPKDRQAAGLRCGTCVFRIYSGAHGYPKCSVGGGVRASHGAATDTRAWWPACVDYQPAGEAQP